MVRIRMGQIKLPSKRCLSRAELPVPTPTCFQHSKVELAKITAPFLFVEGVHHYGKMCCLIEATRITALETDGTIKALQTSSVTKPELLHSWTSSPQLHL